MPAGFAMDQLVAEKVMGGSNGTDNHSNRLLKESGDPSIPWSPSRQDRAAYEVIAAAWSRLGLNFAHEQDAGGHIAFFAPSDQNPMAVRAIGRAETFALAVCRAALKAAQFR